jgi:hypothetical protein
VVARQTGRAECVKASTLYAVAFDEAGACGEGPALHAQSRIKPFLPLVVSAAGRCRRR